MKTEKISFRDMFVSPPLSHSQNGCNCCRKILIKFDSLIVDARLENIGSRWKTTESTGCWFWRSTLEKRWRFSWRLCAGAVCVTLVLFIQDLFKIILDMQILFPLLCSFEPAHTNSCAYKAKTDWGLTYLCDHENGN